MKPSKKLGRSRKIKQKGSGYEISEGPLDTTVHANMNQDQMSKHINWMNSKKERISNDIQKESEKVNNENANLQASKQNDDAKEAALKDKNFQALESQKQREATESAAGVQTFSDFLGKLAGLIAWIATWIGRILVALWAVFKWIVKRIRKAFVLLVAFIAKVVNYITDCIGSVLNGRLVSSVAVPAFKVIFGIIFVIIIIIIIILVILMIFYGISYLIFGDTRGSSSSTSCKNVTEIDLFNFGNPYKTVSTQVNNLSTYRPTFPSIPTYEFTVDNVISNPLTSLNNYMDSKLNSVMNSGIVSTITNKARYGYNMAASGIQYISGVPASSDLVDRGEITGGRSDNVLTVDSDIFDKNSLSNTLNLKDTSLTMVRPNDIEWSIPESEYNYSDIAHVPPSLLKQKNKDGVSLADKKDVIIPWVMKDNFYSLSCSDAYFKNSVKEKANILIDSTDGKTCVFDIDSKTETYKDKAKRYSYVNDLSSFL